MEVNGLQLIVVTLGIFCSLQELSNLIPNARRVNRGSMRLDELVEMARRYDCSDIVVVHEHRGEPGTGKPNF